MSVLEFIVPDWPAPANIRAVATTRIGGVSQGPYRGFNLAYHVGDAPEHVAGNRRVLAGRLGLSNDPAWLEQVHGTHVVPADRFETPPQADAAWTDKPDIACVVMTADCLPVLFCARDGGKVAAAHGGWRGLAGGILEKTVEAMSTDPEELLVWMGPAIGPSAFEVGPEVREAFVSRWPDTEAAVVPGEGDRWFCDIYAVAHAQLAALGIESIHGGGFCTFQDSRRFFSYRRDRETGRQASLIWRAVAE